MPSIVEQSRRATSPEAIAERCCFLCGGQATNGRGEHIFPRWLQSSYSLRDEQLNLQNGTLIPYRNLRIPCCEHCNTGPLSQLEDRVKKRISQRDIFGPEARLDLGQWLLKIFVGVIYAECRFAADRKVASLEKIFPAEELEIFREAHILVNSIKKASSFKYLYSDLPFTFFSFEIDQRYTSLGQYDFGTNIGGKSVSMRVGPVGIIVVADGALQHALAKDGPFNSDGRTLHPFQFGEVAARVHYKAILNDCHYQCQIFEGKSHLVFEQEQFQPKSSIFLPDGSKPLFREWKNEEFNWFLKRYFRFGGLYDPLTGRDSTLLVNADGSPRLPEDVEKEVNTA